MSATLSWNYSGLGTKTGTAVANLINDIVTLVNSKSGDSNFKWQVASSNNASTPYYVVLKRKDASAGRILLVVWTSAPAGSNSAILDTAPSTNNLYGAWFPSGNVDTPSNLTASSGTILGNDTGAVKVWAGVPLATLYTTSFQPFYFDSDEAVVFGFGHSLSAPYMMGAGDLVIDAADNAYGAVFSYGSNTVQNFASTSSPMTYQSAPQNAGNTTVCVRTNYGSSNRTYYHAWAPSSSWASVAISSTDLMSDTANSRVYFVPVQLLGQTKGEGFVLKLRQIGWGPGTTAAFTPYNTTGPVVAARQFNSLSAGGNGFPWFTNFKL